MKHCNTTDRQITRRIALIACATSLIVAFTMARPLSARADIVTPPPVPTDLQVPPLNEAFLLGRGVGTQNYICLPSRSLGRVAWTLITPQATLFDSRDEQLTTHFFSLSPEEGDIVRATWEDSRDTSTVWAKAIAASSDPDFVTAGAIPWLLLEVVGSQAGPTGGETLSKTTFIQRLNTLGGAAPSTDCAIPKDVGNKAFVPYEADYFFFRK